MESFQYRIAIFAYHPVRPGLPRGCSSRGPAALWRSGRIGCRRAGSRHTRRDGEDRQYRHQPHTGNRYRRAGRVQLRQRRRRPLRCEGHSDRVPRSGAIEGACDRRANQPRRDDAAGGSSQRGHHRAIGSPAPADGQSRRPHRAEFHRDHQSPAQSVPKLSGTGGARAGVDAGYTYRKCRDRYAGAFAGCRRERPGRRGQHHAHRRHAQRQRGAAAPQRVHSAGRNHRDGQHHHRQHGRGRRHGRGHCDHRHHQIRHEHTEGLGV